ncbi:MAG: hypothetical protein AAF618_10165, partial [Pseudomonadota bacterium]
IAPEPSRISATARSHLLIPVASLAALTLVIGFFPEPFVGFAEDAAGELLDPTAYLEAVRENGQIAVLLSGGLDE